MCSTRSGGTIIVLLHRFERFVDDAIVELVEFAAECVAGHFADQMLHDVVLAVHEYFLQSGGACKGFAGRKFAGGIDGMRAVGGAVAAEDVEILHAETERIHHDMATGAFGLGAMQFELLAEREVRDFLLRFLEGRSFGRRRFDAFAEERFHDPFAAENRAGAGGIGSERVDGGHAGDATAVFVGELDFAEFGAGDVGDFVDFREAFVGEGVVRIDELEERGIGLDDVIKNGSDFRDHGALEFGIELGEFFGVGPDFGAETFEVEPLEGEPFAERFGFGIGEHAMDLLAIDVRIEKFAGFREREEFFIRHGRPEEVGKAAGEWECGERLNALFFGFRFDQEKKIGRDENGFEREAEGRDVTIAAFPGAIEERHGTIDLGGFRRATIGKARNAGDDFVRGGARFFFAGLGIGAEDPCPGGFQFGRFG